MIELRTGSWLKCPAETVDTVVTHVEHASDDADLDAKAQLIGLNSE
jgi:hypothetical protein